LRTLARLRRGGCAFVKQNEDPAVAQCSQLLGGDYPAANAIVARTGSFSTLHNAFKFASRGRVRPASQKYTHGPLTPTIPATSRTDNPRLMRASRSRRDRLGLRGILNVQLQTIVVWPQRAARNLVILAVVCKHRSDSRHIGGLMCGVDLALSMPLRMVSTSSLRLSVGLIFQWFRMAESIEQVAGPFVTRSAVFSNPDEEIGTTRVATCNTH
jgi:hypothetical protein